MGLLGGPWVTELYSSVCLGVALCFHIYKGGGSQLFLLRAFHKLGVKSGKIPCYIQKALKGLRVRIGGKQEKE